jgi:cobalamin biosynthesis protein CobT
MSARSASQWEYGHKSGSLYGAGLARLATGDTRVFRKKIVSNSKDVAISLLIDLSGSMSGEKITTAVQAALTFSNVLTHMSINHEVLGFTTVGNYEWSGEEYGKSFEKKGVYWARIEPLNIPIFKNFGERNPQLARELAYASKNAKGGLPLRNNVDGESVMIAAKRLKAQPQTRKILIVFSDGLPAFCSFCGGDIGDWHLHKSLAEVDQMGIETFGIGICSEDVAKFYKNYAVVKKLSDLSEKVLTVLKDFLIK